MAAHVRLEGVATGMRKTLSGTTHPFTRVLLLPILNVRVVNVFDQLVHIALLSRWTPIPVTFRNLLLKVLFVETRIDG